MTLRLRCSEKWGRAGMKRLNPRGTLSRPGFQFSFVGTGLNRNDLIWLIDVTHRWETLILNVWFDSSTSYRWLLWHKLSVVVYGMGIYETGAQELTARKWFESIRLIDLSHQCIRLFWHAFLGVVYTIKIYESKAFRAKESINWNLFESHIFRLLRNYPSTLK